MKMKKSGNKSMIIKAVILSAAALLLVFTALRIFGDDSAPLLTAEQAKQAVMNEYSGTVERMDLRSSKYIAELRTDQGRYELELDGTTGAIDSIVLLEPAASAAVPSTPQPSSAASPSPSPSALGAVSEDEAVRLALQEVPGEADDVETEINESGAFYLVEVKTPDGRDALVQVDAISGSIRSVTWEE